MTWAAAQQKIEMHKNTLDECMDGGRDCAFCDSAKEEIAKLELEHGTVHPDHRAKSSGALAR